MTNPSNFDEANTATEEMFAQEQQSPAEPQTAEVTPPADTENPENTSTENPAENAQDTEQTDMQPTLERAMQTAETATEAAQQKNAQLQQAITDIEMLKQENQQLQGTIDEISKHNAENIADNALTPPSLDISELAFADEGTQKSAMAKFVEDMAVYNRQQLMKELSPVLEYAKKGMYDTEKTGVVETLSQIPELSNIQEMLPQLDRIIANNRWLQSDDMPMEEKYINAYAMARGVDSINNPPQPPEPAKEPTTEELLEMYNNNPAFQELVEKQRLEQIKQSQQVPPFSASSGAANAALNIKEKPQTLEEASKRTREMFGVM
mgnify:FL=1